MNSNLMVYVQDIYKVFSDKVQGSIGLCINIYIDCSRAFDFVNHDLLAKKLLLLGLNMNTVKLIESYLKKKSYWECSI